MIAALALSAPPAVPSFVLQVSLAAPPPCAARASKGPLGSIPIASEVTSRQLHLALCDGRTIEVRAEIEVAGELFGVMAAGPGSSSSTFLAPGQSFETEVQGVRLRFTLLGPAARGA